MMITLRVIFQGLIAFVPVIEADANRSYLQVLLPDGRGDIYSADGCKLVSHYPFVVVRAECVSDSDGCGWADGLPKPKTDEAWQFSSWNAEDPKGEAVKIKIGARAPLDLKDPPLPGSFPKSREEMELFSWVPEARRAAVVADDCLNVEDTCPIVAHLKASGTVTTCSLVDVEPLSGSQVPLAGSQSMAHAVPPAPQGSSVFDLVVDEPPATWEKREVDVFSFRRLTIYPFGSGPRQAVASAVMVTIPVSASAESGDIDLQVGPAKVKLKPLKDRREIDIWVLNIGLPDLDTGDTYCERRDWDIDKHFEYFYHLADERSHLPDWRRTIPHLSGEREARIPIRTCPMIDFDGNQVPSDHAACGQVKYRAE